MCVRGFDFVPVSTIFRLDIGTFPTVFCHVVKVEEKTYSSGNLGRYKSILQEEYDKIYLIPKK
jgi:hypothetical protein